MMEDNEEQTLKNLKACRAIIDGLISEYHGRIFNTAGDSVIAEFQSAVDSVVCASEFQKAIELGRSISENNVISVIWHDNVLKMKGGRMYKQILEFLTSQDDVQIKRGVDLVKILN